MGLRQRGVRLPLGLSTSLGGTILRSLVLGVLLGAWASSPDAARGQDAAHRARAREAFDSGIVAFEAENFSEALEAFGRAYAAAPNPIVLVNMGHCYDRLGQPVEAYRHFRAFLEEAPDAPAAQRRDVRNEMLRLRSQLAEVTLRVEPAGALVAVDGEVIGRAPVQDRLLLARGSHQLEVTSTGYSPHMRTIRARGGADLHVDVRLELATGAHDTAPGELASAPPPSEQRTGLRAGARATRASVAPSTASVALAPADESSERDEGGSVRPGTVAVAGVSGACLVAALVTATFAVSAESRFNEANARAQDRSLSPTERLLAFNEAEREAQETRDLSLVADVLGAASLVGAATAVTLLVFDLTRDEKQHPEPALAVIPIAAPGVVGSRLRVRF